MRRTIVTAGCGALCLLTGSYFAYVQAAQAERHPMTFFVTSIGLPGGANLHGLAGADAHCLDLATAVGAGNHTWRAYLSTQERPGKPAVNARDRIGNGPWYNANDVMIAKDVEQLHGENNLHRETALTEQGQMNPGNGSPADPNDKSWAYMQAHPYSIRHEILTGSTPEGRAFADGKDHTCENWTSEEEGNSPSRAANNTGPGAQVGKSDNSGPWNSQHVSGGCSHEALARSHGAGLFYCFAID